MQRHICLRIHMGGGHTDSKSAQPFWLKKAQICVCAPDGIRTPWPLYLQFNALSLTTEPTPHLQNYDITNIFDPQLGSHGGRNCFTELSFGM